MRIINLLIKYFIKEEDFMKNLTRVLSLVLILTMLVSSVAFAGTFTDIEEGSTYAEATSVLRFLS